MARNRVFVPVTTREYAELYGVSQRTAQRRVKDHPGAVKSKRRGRWNIPLTPKQYAEAKGVSQTTARKRGVRVPTLGDFQKVVNDRETPALERQAVGHYIGLLAKKGTKQPPNVETVSDRWVHSTRKQQRAMINETDVPDYDDPFYIGNDNDPLTAYH